MTSSLSDLLHTYKLLIDAYLIHYLQSSKKKLFYSSYLAKQIISAFKQSATKGKSIRGCLVLLVGEMFGQKKHDALIALAATLELFHFGLLVQDDVMDNDLVRRGSQTVFSQYIDYCTYVKTTHTKWTAASLAYLVGDISFFLAQQCIIEIPFPQKIHTRLMNILNSEILKVGIAQSDDVLFGASSIEPSQKQILQVYLYKTARYTFSLPFMLATVACGAKNTIVKQYERLGETIGILFQMRDDELGIIGDERNTGKPVGSDIRENKKTLLRKLLIAKNPSLQKIFLSKKVSPMHLTLIQETFHSKTVQSLWNKEKKKLQKQSEKQINKLPIDNKWKNILIELVSYVQTRTK